MHLTSDLMVFHCNCLLDVLYYTDGKPVKMCRPGSGTATEALAIVSGGRDVNLFQEAYYFGHYGFGGGKVQHVLQAYGMCYSFICPLRFHNALVLQLLPQLTSYLKKLYRKTYRIRRNAH